jgi:hypothetical protein
VLEDELDFLGDRLDVAGVLARADDERIGVSDHVLHVEDDDVLCQLVGADRGNAIREIVPAAQQPAPVAFITASTLPRAPREAIS